MAGIFNALNKTEPNPFSAKELLLVLVKMEEVVKLSFFRISVLKLNFKVVLSKLALLAPTIPSCVK